MEQLIRKTASFIFTIILLLTHSVGQGQTISLDSIPQRPTLSPNLERLRAELDGLYNELQSDPTSTDIVLEIAFLYHANGLYEEALECYTTLASQPRHPISIEKTIYFRAVIKKEQSDLQAARQLLESVAEASPTYLPTYLHLGEVCLKSGKSTAAIHAYQAALELDPENPYALTALARELVRKGDDTKALQYLQKLYRAHPRFSNGKSLYAQVLERLGEQELADRIREAPSDNWEIAPEDPWLELVTPYCYDPLRLMILHQDYRRIGELEKAFTYLDRIQEIDPLDPSPHIARGNAFMDLGDMNKASVAFREALKLGGNPDQIYPKLVTSYFESGQMKSAETALFAGLEAAPHSPELLFNLAGLHASRRDAANAISTLEQLFKINPYHVEGRKLHAQILLSLNNTPKGMESLALFSRLSPKDLWSRALLANYYSQTGQLETAKKTLTEMTRLAPEKPDLYLMLGDIQNDLGQQTEAMVSWQMTLNLAKAKGLRELEHLASQRLAPQ